MHAVEALMLIYVSEHQERKKLDSIEQVSFTTNV